jgi:hypothetical protein
MVEERNLVRSLFHYSIIPILLFYSIVPFYDDPEHKHFPRRAIYEGTVAKSDKTVYWTLVQCGQGTRCQGLGDHLTPTVLPRTTERPLRKCGDECSEHPRRATPQSHGRKSVVRDLLLTVFRLSPVARVRGAAERASPPRAARPRPRCRTARTSLRGGPIWWRAAGLALRHPNRHSSASQG